jgi:hypothetical protein
MTRHEASLGISSNSHYNSMNNNNNIINISLSNHSNLSAHASSRSKPILKPSRSPVQSNSRLTRDYGGGGGGGSGSGSYPSSARDSYESFSGSDMEKLIADNEGLKSFRSIFLLSF